MTVVEIRFEDDLDAFLSTLLFNDMMYRLEQKTFFRNVIMEEEGIMIKYLIWN